MEALAGIIETIQGFFAGFDFASIIETIQGFFAGLGA